jgi:hypothetical protein
MGEFVIGRVRDGRVRDGRVRDGRVRDAASRAAAREKELELLEIQFWTGAARSAARLLRRMRAKNSCDILAHLARNGSRVSLEFYFCLFAFKD